MRNYLLETDQDVTVYPSGQLSGHLEYMHWTPGDSTACLDGHFTFQKLRAIADYMESTKPMDKNAQA